MERCADMSFSLLCNICIEVLADQMLQQLHTRLVLCCCCARVMLTAQQNAVSNSTPRPLGSTGSALPLLHTMSTTA